MKALCLKLRYLLLPLMLFACTQGLKSPSKETHQFRMVTVAINGTKFWLPSSITVRKGDTVKLNLITKIQSKVPGDHVHGFAIDAFKVETVVDKNGKDIEFVANKAGIFPIRCHLHPPHVGGQLIVLE